MNPRTPKKNTTPKFYYVLLNTHASDIVPSDRQIGTFYVNWCWRLKIFFLYFIPQLVRNVMVNGMSPVMSCIDLCLVLLLCTR